MNKNVLSFKELTKNQQPHAGGKGGTLARLYQAGYKVPDGFVILPQAFEDDALKPEAWLRIQAYLARMRKAEDRTAFAVRSSAMSEDSAFASFAGEFETVLDVRTDKAVQAAIHSVRHSRKSERVLAYTKARGIDATHQDGSHEIAVVVQRLVRADISGILFTADPVTGSRTSMIGNYIYGFGEELVSGETEPYTFTLERRKGMYSGPPDLRRYAKNLYKMAIRLEKDLGKPQDIEWCIAGGKLFTLQSRPITTLIGHDPISYYTNTSLTGDYLWVDNGGVYPEVMTPSSWSVWGGILYNTKIDGIPLMGNIGGRLYGNYSFLISMYRKMGKKPDEARDSLELLMHPVPEGFEYPTCSVSLRGLLSQASIPLLLKQRRMKGNFAETIAWAQEKCRELTELIKQAGRQELITLWPELETVFFDLYLFLDSSNEKYVPPYVAIKGTVNRILGAEQGNALLSTLGGAEGLATIRPLVDIARVASGEMSREAYITLYGHRTGNENELAEPRPREDPGWLDKLIADSMGSLVNVEALLDKRAAEFETAWRDFKDLYPKETRKLDKLLASFNKELYEREACRSELTRHIGVIREWFLQAGELTGLGEDIFFLGYQDVLDVLSGDDTALAYIPLRRETHAKYASLPPYPGIIRGRFDPLQWAADPNRRHDIFDANAPLPAPPDSKLVTGMGGSAGRVEGLVRRINSPDESAQFLPGEVLLAITTNIGWTPLFPRAAAVVTDIGAPLAHAAIVARELGIPAVVGCGDATTRLTTGDRVLVDGARGTVEILESA